MSRDQDEIAADVTIALRKALADAIAPFIVRGDVGNSQDAFEISLTALTYELLEITDQLGLEESQVLLGVRNCFRARVKELS